MDSSLSPQVVSRSGRVLKKSSKLMDFTSPDDLDTMKSKKSMSGASKKLNMTQLSDIKIEPGIEINSILSNSNDGYEEFTVKALDSDAYNPENEDDESVSLDSDIEDQQTMIVKEDDPEIEFSTPRRSIYMAEKSSKRKFLKDGKIVLGKAQRKDKGKSRYTAYMLWAKETRQSIQNANPELDFVSVSKRLGEMWSNVPTNVKYNWKRRAKRLATKLRKSNGSIAASQLQGQQQQSKYIQQKYLNKNSTNSSANINPSTPVSSTTMTKQQKHLQKLIKSEKSKKQSIQSSQKQQKEHQNVYVTPTKALVPSTSTQKIVISPGILSSMRVPSYNINKPLDLAPIDIAAHMKLLGESLINIGDRLKEHEGQIAVSGSLSVLLDSILCAMGSLMCCLTYVPCFQSNAPCPTGNNRLPNAITNGNTDNEQDHVRTLFHSIMNNVHYIMPGL